MVKALLPLKPYPLRLGIRDEVLLFFEVRGPRGSFYLSRRHLKFRGHIPLRMLFALQGRYLPLLLPYLEGGRVPNIFLEAYRRKAHLNWGEGLLHQRGWGGRERWIHLDPSEFRLTLYSLGHRGGPYFQTRIFSALVELLEGLPSLLLPPWASHLPREASPGNPLVHLLTHLQEEVLEEELKALRAFSTHLEEAYLRLVALYPWIKASLPPFFPDGRTLRLRSPFAPDPGKNPYPQGPGEDPFLAMTLYWDKLALDLSWGRVDLLPLAPKPLRVKEGWLLYTPFWALLVKEVRP